VATYQDDLPQLKAPLYKHAEKPRDITKTLEAYAG